MSDSARTSIVLLSESSEGRAMVCMRDGDVFFVAAADAARACQAFDKAQEFGAQFKELLETLARWVETHQDRIKSAHMTIRDHDILFLVMQKSVLFDEQLADSLTELDLSIANRQSLNLIDLDVMAVPAVSAGSCSAFLSSGNVFTYAK